MKRALSLAARGRATVSPNPMVGAIIVHHGTIVSEGYHRRPGEPHAEILALHRAGPRARGGTLYVTLEPCCHTSKRTPPCVPLLIQSGIKRVCLAMTDPNPQVQGRGIQLLKRAGLDVSVGVQKEEARQLNEVYVHWIGTGRPFVILKAAMTLDGKIATSTGKSQWITGERARQDVHRQRNHVDAVMVGSGTVLTDDPELSARRIHLTGQRRVGKQPHRIVLDSRLRIPLTARVFTEIEAQPTIVCTTAQAPRKTIQQLQDRGVLVWVLPQQSGNVSLKSCLTRLAKQGVSSLLLEGGSRLNGAALQQDLVNQIRLYMAPMLLGGQDAMGLIGGLSPASLNHSWHVIDPKLKKLGKDWLLVGSVQRTK